MWTRLRRINWDPALACALAAVIAVDLHYLHAGSDAVAYVLGALVGLSLVALHRFPIATLTVSGGFLVALFVHTDSVEHFALAAPIVALYVVGSRAGRNRLLVVGALSSVVVVVCDAAIGDTALFRTDTPTHVALTFAPLLLGALVKTRREYIAVLLEQIALAEVTREEVAQRRVEQERIRIARDLHDVVAHTLTTINVQAGVASHLIEREPERAGAALATVASTSKEAIDELRGIVGILRDSAGEEAPLRPAPTIDALAELIADANHNGLPVDLIINGDRPERLPEAVEITVFRIAQESLTNVRRHAGGVETHVVLELGAGRLRLSVRNDPGLFQLSNEGRGVGIIGMKERAAALDGSLDARALPNGGFEVVCELPYRRPA